MVFQANFSTLADEIAQRVLNAKTESEKKECVGEFSTIIAFKTQQQAKIERHEKYQLVFAAFIIILYLTTNILIAALISKAFVHDVKMIKKIPTYARVIDGKIFIALITGVVIQTGAAFAIVTRFFYKVSLHEKKAALNI